LVTYGIDTDASRIVDEVAVQLSQKDGAVFGVIAAAAGTQGLQEISSRQFSRATAFRAGVLPLVEIAVAFVHTTGRGSKCRDGCGHGGRLQ
jgi:hypothetical protein